jgi:hypothetical protein
MQLLVMIMRIEYDWDNKRKSVRLIHLCPRKQFFLFCPACYLLQSGFYLVHSSTLKMEATCSSDTSVDFQPTARRNIPTDRNIHIYSYWNCKVSVYRWCIYPVWNSAMHTHTLMVDDNCSVNMSCCTLCVRYLKRWLRRSTLIATF